MSVPIMPRQCRRCAAPPPDAWALHDFCALCSGYLCPSCMEAGCCGEAPAPSGRSLLCEHVDGTVGEDWE